MTVTTPATSALKAKHRAMWASGDYADVAEQVIPTLGAVVVDACGVEAGQRVLDVAAGSGNASLPAARRGASVVASDLTPELLDRGRALAEEAGLSLEWQPADAEALPFDDAAFDVVMSCVGVMFAPHHQASADELVRVARPGGTIGLLSWTPEGFIGEMFAAMKPHVAPPPAGAQPPPLWGREDHVRALLGDRVEDVVATKQLLSVDRFTNGADFRDYFKASYGPTIAAYAFNADNPEGTAALDTELAALGDRYLHETADGRRVMDWEYLLLTCKVS